jgi:hypothetical protein
MNTDLIGDRSAHVRPSDDYVGNIPIKLTKEELSELSELSPLRSTSHVVAEWTAILMAIYLCQRHFGILL